MKRLTALGGGLLFFLLMSSMYMMLERFASSTWENDLLSRENELVENSIIRLEKGIKVMEDQVGNSKSAVENVKKVVIDFEEGRLSKITNKRNQAIDMRKPGIKALANQAIVVESKGGDNIAHDTTCSQDSASLYAKTDINIMDVFNSITFDNPDGGAWKQGWPVTYSSKAFDKHQLQVFVVPHSHNDPGWIKTFEQYYSDQTNHILNNIIDALDGHPSRKFIWAEISYFSKWWDDANARRRVKAKEFLNNGQLEIVTGGWVMHDEANTHYYAMIDQMIEGHQWLEKTIGFKPKVGWAIDPFGYSSTMPYLLKRMGFDAMVIQRVHYSLKKHFARKKQLEFRWRQNWDKHASTDILCHTMPFYSYDVPHTCGPEPKICCQFDFRRLPGGGHFCPWQVPPVPIMEHNVEQRAQMLLDQYRKKAQLYDTNVLLVPLGDDFRYEVEFETREQFNNYEKIMDYINSNADLKATVKFGTLSDYFNALKQSKEESTFPSLSGDFMTYADRDDHYWSGYYTSRSFQKHMDRVLEDHLRAAEIIFSLALAYSRKSGSAVNVFPGNVLYKEMTAARRNLGLFQHHDGITGTAKDHVVIDYGNRMLSAINSADKIMAYSSLYLLSKNKASFSTAWNTTSTPLSPIEIRDSHDANPRKRLIIISDQPQTIALYNSLAHKRQQTTVVEISEASVVVKDRSGNEIPCQVNPVFTPKRQISNQKYQLYFEVDLDPLSVTTFTVERIDKRFGADNKVSVSFYNIGSDVDFQDTFDVKIGTPGIISVSNSAFEASFSGENGLMQSITKSATMKMAVDFLTYGTTSKADKSGAYLFLPDGEARPINSAVAPFIVTRGHLFTEVRSFLPMVTHIARIYNSNRAVERDAIEITNIVDIRDSYNKELVMRINSDIKNNDIFFTDLNGFQLQKRKTFRKKLPLQANFYPMPSTVLLQDSLKRLSLHSAQAGGVASLSQGQVEVVLDRRLFQDDNRGLGQGVTDNKITELNYKVVLESFEATQKTDEDSNMAEFNSLHSLEVQRNLQHAIFAFHLIGNIDSDHLFVRFSGLNLPLPCHSHLLNLKTLTKSARGDPDIRFAMIIHRHQYNCQMRNQCSSSMEYPNPDQMFNPLHVSHVEKTSLSLMHSQMDINREEPIQIDPMEIQAYKIGLS